MSSSKKIVGLALVLSAFASSAMAADGADGTVKFEGKIVDTPCAVTIGSQGENVNVTLDTIPAGFFKAAKTKATQRDFTINLNNCDASVKKTATVKFTGATDSKDSSLLAINGGAGAATGVGIEIANWDQSVIPMNSDSAAINLQDGSNELKFTARYVSTVATVTSGAANAQTDFQITYK